MKSPAVTYTFRVERQGKRNVIESARPERPVTSTGTSTSPVARCLALARYVERCVNAGVIENYDEAARKLGITRARMSQVMLLLGLAPTIVEQVILKRLRISERRLRPVASRLPWKEQESLLDESNGGGSSCSA